VKKVIWLCLIVRRILWSCLFLLLFEPIIVASEGSRLSSGHDKQMSSKRFDVYVSQSHGFRVQYEGTLVQRSKDEYVIKLPVLSDGENAQSYIHIFVSRQPFVYLPGTYGGRYYFNDDRTGKTLSDRVSGDSVSVNGIEFARDYWAVYAGQGQWETVINCYALHDGQYYVISLGRNVRTGMPGAVANGSRITKPQMRARLIDAMRDTSNAYVKSFNQILGSFSISK